MDALQVPDINATKKEGRFYHYMYKTEQSNAVELEIELSHTYFDDPAFLEFLKSQKFDLGIGAAFLANSVLFKALGVPHIKIHPEDVESYSLQFKLGMAVSGSSAMTSAYFEYGDLPDTGSLKYRIY